jgi:hypothetical protein
VKEQNNEHGQAQADKDHIPKVFRAFISAGMPDGRSSVILDVDDFRRDAGACSSGGISVVVSGGHCYILLICFNA